MPNKNLYLIGTAHIDLKGPKRLKGLLKHLSPDIVALEFHKDREAIIEQNKNITPEKDEREIDRVLKEVGLSLTPEQKSVMLESGSDLRSVIGYEFNVSKAYTDANPKSRLEYIDISISENEIQEFKESYLEAMKGAMAQEPKLRESFLEGLSKGKEIFLQESMENIDMFYKNAEMMEEFVEFIRNPETFEAIKGQIPSNTIQTIEQIYNPKRDEVMAKEN